MPIHAKTPLIYSPGLSAKAGAHVYLKLENAQPSGSFKSRGVGHLASASVEKHGSAAHLVCSSGGNAGLACACAAHQLGVKSTIFVPVVTKKRMIERLKEWGANVIQGGASWYEADAAAQEYLKTLEGGVYVPPFDHPIVVEGNATLISELKEQVPEGVSFDGLLCSVGGGGLLAGILTGLADPSNKIEVPVIACETTGTASLALSLRESYAHSPPTATLKRLPAITSICSSLGALQVSATCLELSLKNLKGLVSVVMEDAPTVDTLKLFMDDHAFFVEPACAAALVPIYNPSILRAAIPSPSHPFSTPGKVPPKDAPNVVVVLCGGNSVTWADVVSYTESFKDLKRGPVTVFDGLNGREVKVDL